ncbi:MAG: Peptidase family M50 [Candidatus Bathyarchaeota archaeon BA1]|nr:MAG: Peptidase family M50 [Candidatus Bathyarchaeota archaeon BA1]
MWDASRDDLPTEIAQLEQLRSMVESEFDVEEGLIEHGSHTFYVRTRQDSKKGFLRLIKRLDTIGFVPVLRKNGKKTALRIIHRPPATLSRRTISMILFFATVGTTLFTGYTLSQGFVAEDFMPNPTIGAVSFASAIMTILVVHEVSHKLATHIHGIRATAPYFIPGPPMPYGVGTFGAVIQQRSLPPNKDALFDLGFGGPFAGFIMTMIITIIGIQLSPTVSRPPPGMVDPPMPILFRLLVEAFATIPPGHYLLLHPIAFAGCIGMLVTMLNLVPVGMLDGGHAARGVLGETPRNVLSFFSILLLLVLGHYLMAVLALLLSLQRHPGPLDDVSELTTGRKLATLVLVLIFVLCIVPIRPVLR